MYPDTYPPPPASVTPRRPADRPVDPVTVVVGNASMLGVGYMLLRRPWPAAASLTGTVFFLIVLAAAPDALFWRILLVLWWSAVVLHSWRIARPGRRRPLIDPGGPEPAWRSRVFAFGVTGLVLAAFLGLRLETWLVVQSAAQFHADGDCATAAGSLERLGAPHRVAYGAMAATGESDLEACRLLVAALDQEPEAGAETLESYLDHPAARWDGAGPKRAELLLTAARFADRNVEKALKAAFTQLSLTLKETPGQSGRVEEVVEDFLADLAEETPDCQAKRINDWVHSRDWDPAELAEPIAAAADRVPDRMLDCARTELDADEFESARDIYRQFLDRYPEHPKVEHAEKQLYKAESAIERLNVEDLLENEEYCDAPAPYRGADSYKGNGKNKLWMFDLDPDEYDFPKSWTTGDVDDVDVAVCVDGPSKGRYQQTCLYESPMSPYGAQAVKFYASKFKIKAYEIKTGERVAKYTKHIGDPCPAVLTYDTYGVDIGPPSEVESDYSSADVRSMFHRLVD